MSAEPLLDAFCDALWLEDGLARNTIDSYRRDLTLLARWLARRPLQQMLRWPYLWGYQAAPGISQAIRPVYP